jgi:hypothetical protein
MKVMADGRSSDQPAPWRSRNTHNRANRATHTIPTSTIVLAGGDSIVLNHATTNPISEIYRAVKATRHGVTGAGSSDDPSDGHLRTALLAPFWRHLFSIHMIQFAAALQSLVSISDSCSVGCTRGDAGHVLGSGTGRCASSTRGGQI